MSTSSTEFGFTVWGRDFLRIAEPTHVTRPEPALPRARRMARNAMNDVHVEGRLIRGTVVAGDAASVAYLEFAPMGRDAARAVADLVGATPGPSALTDEVHAALGPQPPELAVVDCSCRARSPRCVHVLALLYETIRLVDEDPRLALSLRGFGDALDGEVPADDRIGPWTPLSALDPATFYG